MRPLGVELAAMLADRGVDTVFGIPGVHNIELYRGIEDAGIRHILARHEQGAGFMADGYARASGKPGVAFTISGPGLTNILTPVGQAYSDSVPMLVIATVLDETAAKRGQLHQMKDQEGAGKTVAEWSETARTPEAAYQLVDRAMIELQTKRRRPKIMNVPIAVMGGDAGTFPSLPATKTALPAADRIAVTELGPLLANADHPLFILGGGLSHDPRAQDVIERMLDIVPAAVFTTYAGRGLVKTDYPLSFGAMLARPESAAIAARSDMIIVIGTELAEVDLWRDTLGDTDFRVRVDISPEVLVADTTASRRFCADGVDFLIELAREMENWSDEETPLKSTWSPTDIAATRARWKAEVDAESPGIVPLCDALSKTLPQNTMIFSDMTQFAYAAKEVWDLAQPGLWHHPTGFGTLGYALPAAIGGALGHQGPTLAILGDYGIQYTLPELGTAAELGLSLPILIWDNDALGQIRDNMVEAQIAPNAVTLKNPKWQKIAEAYDCAYSEPETTDDLCQRVNAAFSAGKPTLIRVVAGRLA